MQSPANPYAPTSPSHPWAPGPAQSAQNFVHLGRLLTLLLLLVELVVGIIIVAVSLFFGLAYGAFFVVGAVVGLVVYVKLGEVESQIGAGQYGPAKDGLIIWGILGVIFVWVIPGIFLLLAYLKLDEVIRATPPGYGYPMASYPGASAPGLPPSAGMPPGPTSSPAAPAVGQPMVPPPPPPAGPLCPTCGQAATFIPQYGRYYCYSDQRYL